MQLSEEMQVFLNERRFAVLATIDADGLPHQTVMWFKVQGDEILMNTKRGRVKERHLRHNPRASICVEAGHRYVTIAGTVRLNDDQAVAQADIAYLADRYNDPETKQRNIAVFRQEHRVTIRMRVERVIARGFER